MKKSVRRVSKKKIYNNRLMYSLIALGILIVVAVGAYALTPGVAPANGHVITSIAPPSGCGSNTYLKWTGSAWSCASTSETDPTVEAWAKTNSGDIQANSVASSGGIFTNLNILNRIALGGGNTAIGSSCTPSTDGGVLQQCGTPVDNQYPNVCTCVYGKYCGSGSSTYCWEWRAMGN